MLACVLMLAMGATPSNSLCPVTGIPVTNHRLYHHVTVKGRQYFVQDLKAANRLRNAPECYLKADGTPLPGEAPQLAEAR